MNAAGQTGSPDPAGVSAADKTEQKRRSADYLADRLFVTGDQGGDLCDDNFRHPGRRR